MLTNLLILFLLALQACDGLKYLVYNPKFGRSHVLLMGKLADELANAGHEVVVLQTQMNSEFNFTGSSNKKVRVIEVEVPQKMDNLGAMHNIWKDDMDPGMLGALGEFFRDACINLYDKDDILTQLRDEKFDLGVGEWFDVCGLGLFKFIGVKRWITVFGGAADPFFMGVLGVPPSVSIVPGLFDATTERTFMIRLKDQFGYFFGKYKIFPTFQGTTAEAFKKFDKDVTFEELIAQSSFIWVNVDEFVDFPRPISHKYINIAGYGMKKAMAKTNKLDQKYQKIFDKAEKGVVYMSFGSVAESKLMPPKMKQAILEAFAQFPDVQFIWKYEKDEDNVAKGYSNVHTEKWLPQREILAHPRCLAFITHGGMNSITETTYAGIPTISIPLFGDQMRNAAMVEAKGTSKVLKKEQLLDKQAIVDTLKELIDNQEFKRRAVELSEIIKNKPGSPERRIVESAEFAARFDVQKHLDISGRHLSAVQFYNIDVFAFAFTVVLVVLLSVIFVIGLVVRAFRMGLKSKAD
uniref:glucuronosyltransferase n=1 Tax=Bursaphelenchus xylophilus TaxID=6326 RepID=A0A1I7RMB9_BURXY